MAGSSFGRSTRIVTFGESHGPAVGVVIDGVRPGLRLSTKAIQKELDKRRPGHHPLTSARKEEDRVEVLSGVFEGKTTGTPICLIIRNRDQRPEEYESLRDVFRPGHAGYTYLAKYGVYDHRGGGRSSGRETAARVAAGAFAKALLARRSVEIIGHVVAVGRVRARSFSERVIGANPLRCADPDAAGRMERLIQRVRKEGDSIGGIVEVIIRNPPAGLGDPVFGKLDAELAGALMSIGAVKGVEVGSGFGSALMRGSEHNDPIYRDRKGRIRTRTNNAGGIVGGISNGEEIILRLAVKPTSSIAKEQASVDRRGRRVKLSIRGRHDPCVCPRVVPVAEAMCALVLVDHMERQADLRRTGRRRGTQG